MPSADRLPPIVAAHVAARLSVCMVPTVARPADGQGTSAAPGEVGLYNMASLVRETGEQRRGRSYRRDPGAQGH